MPAPISRFLACLLTLFALAFPLLAQDAPPANAPLQMALSSPFSLTQKPLLLLARRGKWFPVAVTLSNTGDAVAGTLRLQLRSSDSENASNQFYCPVDLPTNARKVIWLYGRLDRPNVAAVEVSFEGRGFKTLMQRVPLQEPEENQRVVLTVSDADSALSDSLKSLRGSGLSLSGAANLSGFNPSNSNPSASQAPLRPLETAREGVPDRWFGLEGADLVVLGDFAHSALLPPQLESLRGFVSGGGNLLAMGGSNAARLSGSPLADLWPEQLSVSNSATAKEVADIVDRYIETPKNGADRLGGSPVVVTRGALKNGAQLRAGSIAAPMFSYLDVGAGRVGFLAFDPSQPPFNGWSGQSALWRDVFRLSVKPKHLDTTDSDAFDFSTNYGANAPPPTFNYDAEAEASPTSQLLTLLAKAAQQRKMPPVSQIAWFLALYVFVLVPLNYSILRFIDRRELAWISIPLIVVAFSTFAYAAARSIRGTDILTRQIDVVQSSFGSTQARADSLLWLFSPQRTTYDISSSIPSAAVSDYVNQAGLQQGAFSILQPADAAGFKVENANVWMWTERAFSAQSVVPLGKGLRWNGDRVQNGSPLELRGAVWVQDRKAHALGTLKSGASVAIPAPSEKAIDVDLLEAIVRASQLSSIFDKKAVENRIPQTALSAALGHDFGRRNTGGYLIAWATQAAAPLSIGIGGARTSDLSLMIFRAAPPQSSRLSAREAFATRVAFEPAANRRGGRAIYECQLPDAKTWLLQARGVGANTGREPVEGRGIAPWAKFEALNTARNRWESLGGTLRRDKSAQGGWNFSARVSSDFARQPDRLLRVRVTLVNSRVRVSSLRVSSSQNGR